MNLSIIFGFLALGMGVAMTLHAGFMGGRRKSQLESNLLFMSALILGLAAILSQAIFNV